MAGVHSYSQHITTPTKYEQTLRCWIPDTDRYAVRKARFGFYGQ